MVEQTRVGGFVKLFRLMWIVDLGELCLDWVCDNYKQCLVLLSLYAYYNNIFSPAAYNLSHSFKIRYSQCLCAKREKNKWKTTMNLPGHVWQSGVFCTFGPLHAAPPFNAIGFEQLRTRFWPTGARPGQRHSVHWLHELHPPFTVKWENNCVKLIYVHYEHY